MNEVQVKMTYRDGSRATISLPPFSAALLVLYPPAEVASLRVVGGVDDYLRSHVPFIPFADRPIIAAKRSSAPCN